MKTQQLIESLGWQVEIEGDGVLGRPHYYRAFQGGFKTLYRPTPEQTLKDVQSIVNARKDPANQRVPF